MKLLNAKRFISTNIENVPFTGGVIFCTLLFFPYCQPYKLGLAIGQLGKNIKLGAKIAAKNYPLSIPNMFLNIPIWFDCNVKPILFQLIFLCVRRFFPRKREKNELICMRVARKVGGNLSLLSVSFFGEMGWVNFGLKIRVRLLLHLLIVSLVSRGDGGEFPVFCPFMW